MVDAFTRSIEERRALTKRRNGTKAGSVSWQDFAGGRLGPWCLRGYAAFHCLFALLQVGFFDELAARGAIDIRTYASEKQLDYDKLEAIARYLYGLGILNRDDQGRFFFDREIPAEELAAVELFYAYDPLFHNLVPVLRQEKSYGKDIDRLVELDVTATAKICGRHCYAKIIELVEKRQAKRVLDLGCGSAELLIRLCKRNSEMEGFGIDISPAAVRCAQDRIDEEQLGDRARVSRGDIFDLCRDRLIKRGNEPDIDLILSTSVFHEFAYKSVKRLIEALARVKQEFDGVEVILFEALEQSDESLRRNSGTALEHHLFHRLSMQGIASKLEWQPAFEQAGYALLEEIPLMNGMVFVIR